MASTVEDGKIGEDYAERFLVFKGYEILKRNFKFGRISEIDIIAKDNEEIVFVEVKYRTNTNYGDPLFSITPSKQKAIRRAAEGWLYVNKINDKACRFDVVIIEKKETATNISHIKNAF